MAGCARCGSRSCASPPAIASPFSGFDQPSAEVFVNLATGATLPDAGDVSVFGRPTTAIDDSADWLATVDRFGIVSERAVLLDALTVIQNLAMPFTLEIEPPPDDGARARRGAGARGGAAGGVVDEAGRRARRRRDGCASGSAARSRSIRPSCCSSTPAPGSRARRSAAIGAQMRARGRRARDRAGGGHGRRGVRAGRGGPGADARAGDRPAEGTAPMVRPLRYLPFRPIG